jgi:hypothetical protein
MLGTRGGIAGLREGWSLHARDPFDPENRHVASQAAPSQQAKFPVPHLILILFGKFLGFTYLPPLTYLFENGTCR